MTTCHGRFTWTSYLAWPVRTLFVLAAFVGSVKADGAGQFQQYVTYPHGAGYSGTTAVAIGDLNGDRLNDVAMSSGGTTYVHLQNPSGGLNASIAYSGGGASIAIGDVNNDGRNDLVVSAASAVGVLYQNDQGGLNPMVSYASAHASYSNVYKLKLGDFNDDGLLDVASIDWGTQSEDVDIHLQQPDGTLGSAAVYVVSHGGWDDLEVGDVNGDGRDDIVVMSGQSYAIPNVGVLLQNATGRFNAPVYYSLGVGNTHGIGVGDLNGDLFDDVAVSYGGNRPSSSIGVLLQNSAGGLNGMSSYASYDIPEPVEVADIDQDGRGDLVVVHGGWNALGLYRQSATGSLLGEELYVLPYASHYNPHGLAAGDINGDGLTDVAIGDYNYGLVVLYHLPSSDAKPLVTVKASDRAAEKSTGDPGVFTITLSKAAAAPLTVSYRLHGTAINGVDYSPLGNTTTIPAGATSVQVVVSPVAGASAECLQTAALKLLPHLDYVLGTANRDTILINNTFSAIGKTVATLEDTSTGITLTASTCDNPSLVFTVLTQPAHGTLSGAAPSLTYTPAANYNGSDSFTFKVNDGQVDSAPATINLTVTPVNDAPTFALSGTSITVKKNSGAYQKAAWVTNVNPGPPDESGQRVNFIASNTNPTLFSTQPAISSSGTLTFTPKKKVGTATVTVIAQDNGGTADGGSDRSASRSFTITTK